MSEKKDMKKRVKEFLNGNENDFYSQIKDKSYLEYHFGDIEEQADLLKDINKLREIVHLFTDNFDKLAIGTGMIDKDLYQQINNIIKVSFEFNTKKFYILVGLFLSHIETKYPFHKLTYNLLFIRENYPEFYKLFKETPLSGLQNQIVSTLYKLIEEKQEDQFYDYFFDWVLKFGYLIEAYVKEILIFHQGLDYLLKNKNFNEIKKKDLTVGNLVRNLKADKTIALYRNSIFHTSFLLHYNINLEEKKITFLDLYGKSKIITIEEFIAGYFKLLKVVFTYICAIIFHPFIVYKETIKTYLKKKIDPFLRELTKIDKDDFIKKMKEIQEDLDKRFNK
ncbi:MAG: hypothetical protein V3V33_08525 [Candidatus Lokiarchaeia archaeon]